jgi:hypothetical protein
MSVSRVPGSRAGWLFATAIVMAILGILLSVSSLLLWVVFPHGFYPSRVIWVEIHKWAGVALTIVVLLHVFLHRRWLLVMSRRFLMRR